MPYPSDLSSTVDASEFVLQGNPDAHEKQANETFLVTTQGTHILGSAGQVKGFAKYQFQGQGNEELRKRVKDLGSETDDLLQKNPQVQSFDDARKSAAETSQKIQRAQQELEDTRHLAGTDPVRQGAQRKLDDLQALLKQNQQEMDDHRRKSKVVREYERLSDELAKIKPVVARQDTIHGNSSALYNEDSALKTPGDGGDRSLLSRAVGSKLVDNFLGTDALAEERFGVDSRGRPIGISVQVEGAGVTSRYGGKECFLETDYSDSGVQKGLSDLEVNDYITGQIDRHPGNIFVDPITKKVTGIDNDLAFPECSRQEAIQNNTAKDRAILTLPSPIHKDTADKIRSRDPEALRKQLKEMPAPNGVGKLSDASINGAVDRLKELQAGLKSGAIQTVDQFSKQTYDAAMTKQSDVVKKGPAGKDLNQCQTEKDLYYANRAERTSYLGALAVTKQKVQAGVVAKPDEFGMRPQTAVSRMSVDPRFKSYQKLDDAGKKQFEKTANEFLDLEKRHIDCRERQNALNVKPHGMKAVTAFFNPDKLKQAKQALLKEERDLLNQMHDKLDKLDDLAKQNANKQQQQQHTKPPSDLRIDQKDVAGLLTALDKLDKNPTQKPSDGLNLDKQEATQMVSSLQKLGESGKHPQPTPLTLSSDEQSSQELHQALDKLTPEKLQQAGRISGSVQFSNEDVDQLIADLKILTHEMEKVAQMKHSVASDLHMNHVGEGTSVNESVSTKQQQKAGTHHLRDDHPELVIGRGQGQKTNAPHHGEHL